MHSCSIEKNVTLKDILLVIKDWTSYLSPMLTSSPGWLEEIVKEGLSKKYKYDGELEHLELSWRAEENDYSDEPEFYMSVSFDGVSFKIPKTDDYKNWPKGTPIRYAIEMTPVYELVGLPIKLNTKFNIYNGKDFRCEKPMYSSNKNFSLLEILYGIFWELTFFGSPVERDKMSDSLKKQVDDIKSGKVKGIPIDVVKEKLKLDRAKRTKKNKK